MQSSAGDEVSTPREEAPKQSPVSPMDDSAGETTAKGAASRLDERDSSARVEEDEEESTKKNDEEPQPRRERSVMFADMLREEVEPLTKKESGTLPTIREAPAATATPERVGSFSLLRKLTTELFSIPFGFFKSRAELRTWGEETLADPSVQPRHPSTAQYGWGSLPNYPEKSTRFFKSGHGIQHFYSLAPKGGYRPASGVPVLQFVPSPVRIPQSASMKPPSYDWNTLKDYRMDTFPYPVRGVMCRNRVPHFVIYNVDIFTLNRMSVKRAYIKLYLTKGALPQLNGSGSTPVAKLIKCRKFSTDGRVG